MAYFSLTLIVTALMTLLPPIFLVRILANGVSIPAYVSTPLLPLFCFLVMCGYGYIITKKVPVNRLPKQDFMLLLSHRLSGICSTQESVMY